MVENKSDRLSVVHKDKGNKLFKKSDFHTALVEYNKVNLKTLKFRTGS